MKLITSLNETHIKDLHRLYQGEWWSKGRSLEDTHCCVTGSQINLGYVDQQDKLQAYARVLTDYVFKALIFDLIVAPPHRNKGLGQHLLSHITHHKDLTRIQHFELYCKDEMQPFYIKQGFIDQGNTLRLMRLGRSSTSLDPHL